MYDKVTDLMPENAQGDHELVDAVIEGATFKTFSGGVALGKRTLFRNVTFRSCKVFETALYMSEGAVLEDVTFDNLDCRRPQFDFRVVMKRVKFIGGRATDALRVKYFDPFGSGEKFREDRRRALQTRQFGADESLDITEYYGEVEIAGFPASRVQIDPKRHIVIRSALKSEVDWEGLGIPRSSAWRMMAAHHPDCEDAVFSMPNPSEEGYEEAMAELEILRSAGFVNR